MSQENANLPLPPVESYVDLRELPKMMVDVRRLLACDRQEECTRDSNWIAFNLWCEAWHLMPAGSLPNNDIKLSKLAGFGTEVDRWLQYKDQALRGYRLCSDGRLHHSYLSQVVNEAWDSHLAYLYRKLKDRLKKAGRKAPSKPEWIAAGRLKDWPFADSKTAPSEDSPRKTENSEGAAENSGGILGENALKEREVKERKDKHSLSPASFEAKEEEREGDQDLETETVFKKLFKSGWGGNREDARKIKDAFEVLGMEALDEAINFCKDKCNVWTISTKSGTTFILNRAQIMMAQVPPGRGEGAGQQKLQPTDCEEEAKRAQVSADVQARSALRQGVLSLPAHQQTKLLEDFVSSPESKPARKSLELNGWHSTSGAVWATLRHWLMKVDRDLLAKLTGSPVSCNVIQLPMPASTTAPEEVDLGGLARIDKLMRRC